MNKKSYRRGWKSERWFRILGTSGLTFVLELVSGLGRLVLDVLHHVVDLGFVLEEEGPHDAGVDQDGAVGGGGGHAPHQEGTLGGGGREEY